MSSSDTEEKTSDTEASKVKTRSSTRNKVNKISTSCPQTKTPTIEIQPPDPNLLSKINFNSNFCSIILKLGDNLEDIKEESLEYKDVLSLCSCLNIKKNRHSRKIDMISEIISKYASLWLDIKSTAKNILDEEASQAKLNNQKNNQIHPLIQKRDSQSRTPFDAKLADLLADIYMTPNINMNSVLITTSPNESETIRSTFKAMNPELKVVQNKDFSRDSLFLTYITGIIRQSTHNLNEFSEYSSYMNDVVTRLIEKKL